MDIYLIRHTTPDVDGGVCYGRTDIGIVDSFPAEARAVRAKLPTDRLPVFSSPLKRCLLLAQTLSEHRPVEDERLAELDFGAWEMQRWNDIDRPAVKRFLADYANVCPPAGESLRMVHRRASDFLAELASRPEPAIAVVSHSAVIRSLLAGPLGVPLTRAFDIVVDYGSVSLLQVSAAGPELDMAAVWHNR